MDRYVPNSEGCAVVGEGVAFGAYSTLWSPCPAMPFSPSPRPAATAPNASPVIRASGAIVDALCSLNQTPQHHIVYEQPSPFSSFVLDSALPSHELEQLKRELDMEATTALAREHQCYTAHETGQSRVAAEQPHQQQSPKTPEQQLPPPPVPQQGCEDQGFDRREPADRVPLTGSAAGDASSTKNRGLEWLFTVASVEAQSAVDFENNTPTTGHLSNSFDDTFPQLPLDAECMLGGIFGKPTS